MCITANALYMKKKNIYHAHLTSVTLGYPYQKGHDYGLLHGDH